MSKVSVNCERVAALFIVCAFLGVGRGQEKPAAGTLAHYRFNGDAKDANKGNKDFELVNIPFKDNAIYLEGRDDARNIAACNTLKLDYVK